MKQNVVDVLMYLFEYIIGEEAPIDPERDHVQGQLEELGFPKREILRAFDWLEDLADVDMESIASIDASKATRLYSELEMSLLDIECVDFLIYLEHAGILMPSTRELILDRVIALDVELDVEQLKWIVMIVLYSHPDEENAYEWMENMVFDQNVNYMH